MKSKEGLKNEITFIEACQILKKSRKTLGKYIKAGKLIPERILSKKGTLEYRFKRADLDSFIIPGKDRKEETRREETSKDNEVISLLKDTMQVLKKQLLVKDKIIANLLERSRETNVLIKGLQDKVLLLEGENRGERREETRQGEGKIKGFFNRLFKR